MFLIQRGLFLVCRENKPGLWLLWSGGCMMLTVHHRKTYTLTVNMKQQPAKWCSPIALLALISTSPTLRRVSRDRSLLDVGREGPCWKFCSSLPRILSGNESAKTARPKDSSHSIYPAVFLWLDIHDEITAGQIKYITITLDGWEVDEWVFMLQIF